MSGRREANVVRRSTATRSLKTHGFESAPPLASGGAHSYTGNRARFPDPLRCSIPGATQREMKITHTRWVVFILVGPPGIEPGLNAPHALVLPVYYGPVYSLWQMA